MTDTADKRRSTLGNSLLPLAVYFSPDASISKADRRHAAALYRGIDTATSNFFRWIPEQNSSSTYRCEQNNSLTNTEEQNSTLQSAEEKNSTSTYECEQDSGIESQEQNQVSED